MANKIHQDIDNIHLYLDENAKDAQEDFLVCECNGVSLADIREEFQKKKFDLNKARKKFKLGSGCASCIKNKLDWINKIHN